jgi:eukaryotic-like serine/threonine-protein kinase
MSDDINAETQAAAPTNPPGGLDAETVVSRSPSLNIPKRIGQYTVKRVLASGGMGTVYLAVQDQPKRTVALKVMKKGIVSNTTLKRFEFESQVLARLRHPNIGQIFESGTFDDGDCSVPYFAMEYIPHAKTIEDHVRSKGLGSREILGIFVKICDAIHHGHQKGVIHRDLKPDNILVDSSGEPKIIDFGVARSTESDLAVSTLQTDVGQLVGTLQYMSPEQCDADPNDLDTRTDVYSLGVVLYELLCGALPYDVSRVAIFEAARVIKEAQPRRPSTLNRTLQGDLETITLKALEKDRDRRYQSATAFADDLHRYLRNEPIEARSASMVYQTKMFVRRNRAAFAAGVTIFVFMVIATIVSVTFGIRAVKSGRIASAAERDAIRQKDIAIAAQSEAELAREESDRQREEAVIAKAVAEKQSYIVNVAAAAAALDEGAIETAKRRLRLAPQQMRNWEWQYLSNLADQSIATLPGSEALITSVAFSANGSWIVSGSTDGAVRVIDPATQEEPVHFAGHASPVYAVACSPDGQHVASASADMTIRIWSLTTGDRLSEFVDHTGVVTSLAYDPQGRYLVSGSSDSSLRVWDAQTGEVLTEIPIEDASVDAVAISPDGLRVASGSDDGLIRLWEVATGELAWAVNLDAGYINALRFSPDGSRIGSATEDGMVRLLAAKDGATASQLVGHNGFASDIAFSPDGTSLACGSEDGTVRLWDLSTGHLRITLHGHDGFVKSVAFSPDGRRVASGSDDLTIKLWDARLFEHVEQTLDAHTTTATGVGAIAMSADGMRLIGGRNDGSLLFWDVLSGSPLGITAAHQDPIRSIAVSPDGSLLATASDDSTIVIRDTSTAKVLGTLTGHKRRVTSTVFRPNHAQLFSGSWDGSVRAWDLNAMPEHEVWQIQDGSINALALSPDGTRLACASSNGDIVIIETDSGETQFVLSGHKGPVNCLAYSPDGERLVSGSSDATIRLWDTASGHEIKALPGHEQSVTALAITPDGLRIISASLDKTMRVWTADTGEEVCALPWLETRVDCLVMSPDGHKIAAGLRDGSISVRDSMPQMHQYKERADIKLIEGSARRAIDAFIREGLDVEEMVERIRSDDSLSDSQRRAALDLILSLSLRAQGTP